MPILYTYFIFSVYKRKGHRNLEKKGPGKKSYYLTLLQLLGDWFAGKNSR